MAKFTTRGYMFAIRKNKSNDHATNFDEVLQTTLSAVAGNAGWAGLNPEATATKAIETAIAFCNQCAELAEDTNKAIFS